MKIDIFLKRIFSAIRIFLAGILIFGILSCGLYLLGIFGYMLIFHSIPGDAPTFPGTMVFAWVDANGDGKYETGELPLSGTCIWVSANVFDYKNHSLECESKQSVTDADGHWETLSGGDVYVFATPPPGFQYSTPPVVQAVDQQADFGFAPNSTAISNKIASMEFYANSLLQQENKKKAITYLIIGIVVIILFYVSWRIAEKTVAIR